MEVIEIDNSAKHSIVFHGKLKENREKLCDVQLKVQDTLIPGHKIILASNSDYFQNMFAGTVAFGDSNNSVIAIEPEFSLDSIKSIVNYIYTGKLSFILENATNLLKAADFYGIEFIKESCRDILVLNITEENRITTWCLFEQLNCDTEDVDKLIAENIHPVLNHPDFPSLSGQFVVKFFTNIIKFMPKNCSEEIYFAMLKWIKHDEARKPFFTELIKLFPLEYIKPILEHNRNEKLIMDNNELISWLLTIEIDAKCYEDRSKCAFIMERNATFYWIVNLETMKLERKSSPIEVTGFSLTTINSKVFVTGGKLKNGEYSKVCHIYDSTTENWSTIPFLYEIENAKSCHLNGTIYLLGTSNKKTEIITFNVETQNITKLYDLKYANYRYNIYISDDTIRVVYINSYAHKTLRVREDKIDLAKKGWKSFCEYEIHFHSIDLVQFYSCSGITTDLLTPLWHHMGDRLMTHYIVIQNYIKYDKNFKDLICKTFSSYLEMNSNSYGISSEGIHRLETNYTWNNIFNYDFERAMITPLQGCSQEGGLGTKAEILVLQSKKSTFKNSIFRCLKILTISYLVGVCGVACFEAVYKK